VLLSTQLVLFLTWSKLDSQNASSEPFFIMVFTGVHLLVSKTDPPQSREEASANPRVAR